MAHFLQAYNSALLRRPMLVQCLTAATMFGAGDIIAQQAVERKGLKDHDFLRTARLTFYGGAMFGPLMTKWYQFLNGLAFKTPFRALASRVWLDQAVLTPAGVVFFYGSMSTLEGNWDKAIPRIKDAYVPTLLRNWAVFIPTQILNFTLVPPHLRLVTVGVVSLFWNTYLSAINAHHQHAMLASQAVVDEALAKAADGVLDTID